ncbi:cytidylate kinase family protein [Candidatus Gottesmanbacteria bacterium]|nr:cytidylate kinase family protein [Candidatus Gottesmanbacteria bacterium]
MPYRNITISGRVASGATTLSRALADKIGWKLINGGEIVRDYMKKKSIPLEHTFQTTDRYHLDLDEFIKNKLQTEDNLIVESWLSGYDAQGIDGVFKIYVACSDDSVRIDRIVNRDRLTIDEAKEHLKTREEENLKKWDKIYHTRDFWNPKLYDLIIDTYQNGPSETLQLAVKAIGFDQ